jgi:hypothetical protein
MSKLEFADLPNEMAMEIMEKLDIHQLLPIRETSRHNADRVNNIIERKHLAAFGQTNKSIINKIKDLIMLPIVNKIQTVNPQLLKLIPSQREMGYGFDIITGLSDAWGNNVLFTFIKSRYRYEENPYNPDLLVDQKNRLLATFPQHKPLILNLYHHVIRDLIDEEIQNPQDLPFNQWPIIMRNADEDFSMASYNRDISNPKMSPEPLINSIKEIIHYDLLLDCADEIEKNVGAGVLSIMPAYMGILSGWRDNPILEVMNPDFWITYYHQNDAPEEVDCLHNTRERIRIAKIYLKDSRLNDEDRDVLREFLNHKLKGINQL